MERFNLHVNKHLNGISDKTIKALKLHLLKNGISYSLIIL